MAKAIIATRRKFFTNAATLAAAAALPSTAQSAPIDREALVKLVLELQSIMKDMDNLIANLGQSVRELRQIVR